MSQIAENFTDAERQQQILTVLDLEGPLTTTEIAARLPDWAFTMNRADGSQHTWTSGVGADSVRSSLRRIERGGGRSPDSSASRSHRALVDS